MGTEKEKGVNWEEKVERRKGDKQREMCGCSTKCGKLGNRRCSKEWLVTEENGGYMTAGEKRCGNVVGEHRCEEMDA